MILNRVESIPETIVRYFSFFTILTNMIVAICCTVFLLKSTKNNNSFFSKPATVTAIAVYITVVGIVYNIILRSLWKPEGLQRVVDELLHSVIPILFIIFWFLYAGKAALKWKSIFPWLLYPLLYVVVILIRGASSGFYPYPFINVNELGYSKVLINSIGLVIAFLFLSLLFVAIQKFQNKNKLQ